MEKYLPPFLVRLFEYSMYAKVKIADHREYKSIEVMGVENHEGRILVHVILSFHNGTSIRFINDREMVQIIKQETPARKAFYTPIELEHSVSEEQRRLNVRLYTEKGEEIVLLLVGGRPARASQGFVTNPTGFFNHHDLPIGFTFNLRKVLPHSSLHINRREYALRPIKEFMGHRYGPLGRMGEDYARVNLTTPAERMHCTAVPKAFEVGEKWRYDIGCKTLDFRIVKKTDTGFIVMCGRQKHYITLQEGKMQLRKISFTETDNGAINIFFNPPFPVAHDGERVTSRVTLSTEGISVYEGMLAVSGSKEDNIITFMGDRKYHTVDDDLSYETTYEGEWVLHHAHQGIIQ